MWGFDEKRQRWTYFETKCLGPYTVQEQQGRRKAGDIDIDQDILTGKVVQARRCDLYRVRTGTLHSRA